MATNNGNSGLSSAEQVIAAGEALTQAANAGQQWVRSHFSDKAINQAEAQELFGSVNQIRHVADLLFIAAAAAVVSSLGEPQTAVLGVISDAQKAMAKIQKAKQAIDLLADVVVLATAINSGQARVILAAMKAVRADVSKVAPAGNV